MMSAAQQAAQAQRQLNQQAAQNARQQAAAQKQAAQLASQQARYNQQLLLKSTPTKSESRGFNLDSLGDPSAIDQLAAQYDQVQFKNGSQSVLLQRAVNGATVSPHADVNANGVLQVVPDAGASYANYEKAQANSAAQLNPAMPATEKVLLLGGAAVLLVGGIFLLRRKS